MLKIKLKPRVFYDSLRRLITIERFLDEDKLNPLEIEKEIKNLIGERNALDIKVSEGLDETLLKKIRKIITSKLNKINKKI